MLVASTLLFTQLWNSVIHSSSLKTMVSRTALFESCDEDETQRSFCSARIIQQPNKW